MVNETIAPGYKQTEIGIIPEDWEVKKVKEFGEIITGGTPSTQIKHYWNGTIPWVTPTDISDKKEIYHTEREITLMGLNVIRKLTNNSVLVTCIASIGKNVILKNEGACNQQINAIIPNKKYNADFLYYLFENNKQFLLSNAGITATNIISKKDFTELSFLVPNSKEEQAAIAQVLSDTDSLIESLDKLIEKKKNIKQGTMQQLLSGKKRLLGFSGDWEEKTIRDFFFLSAGQTKTKYIQESGKYIIMDMGAVSVDGKNISTKYTNYNKDMLQCGDLIMPKDDIGGGFIIGKTVYINEDNKYILGDHVYKLKAKEANTNTLYLSYLINSHCVNIELKKKVAGSAQLGLGRKAIETQELIVPKSKEEQSAIAQVLSDMDAEIERLEQKRDKYKQLKIGMMQQLLTGRIRLKW